MRIIAGKYKRTPIRTLEGEDITRPTRDMVKEALFSTITIYSDTAFLDLFAGSGAIGLEALSRGAAEVVFNDINVAAQKVIKANLDHVHEEREVCGLDYQECLKKLEGRKFDYIYCDPPYRFRAYDDIFYYVNKYKLLKENGIIILETDRDTDLKDQYLNMCRYKEKIYGITRVSYYKEEHI